MIHAPMTLNIVCSCFAIATNTSTEGVNWVNVLNHVSDQIYRRQDYDNFVEFPFARTRESNFPTSP